MAFSAHRRSGFDEHGRATTLTACANALSNKVEGQHPARRQERLHNSGRHARQVRPSLSEHTRKGMVDTARQDRLARRDDGGVLQRAFEAREMPNESRVITTAKLSHRNAWLL